MIGRDSRYAAVGLFTSGAEAVVTEPRDVRNLEGVVEHVVTASDRLDLLALHYYGDDRAWWRIVDANPQVIYPGDLLGEAMVGRVILIPAGADAR